MPAPAAWGHSPSNWQSISARRSRRRRARQISIWSRSLGADIVIDYKKEDFEKILSGYDVVLNSLDSDTLEKSLNVLKPGGKLISISGPPDLDFAKEIG